MKKISFVLFFALALMLGNTCCGIYKTAKGKKSAAAVKSDSKPISHEIWNDLLKKNVNSAGMVNYKSLQKDSAKLRKYTDLLSQNHPSDQFWSKNEQKAYWINAYNAFTVALILKNYPVKSIKEIGGKVPFVNSTWDIKFIKIEGKTYDLNNIEHNILRPIFKDPRVHFAINCASKTCAKLRNEAYVSEKLDAQLDDAGRQFLNDPTKTRNHISAEKAQLSMYFKWFSDDFGDIPTFINRFSDVKISAKTPIDFLEYNWNLNEAD
jgi:Protein of unknown function, DUF547